MSPQRDARANRLGDGINRWSVLLNRMTGTEPASRSRMPDRDDEPKHVQAPTPFTEDEQGIFRALVADHRVIDGLLERLELGDGDRAYLVEEVLRALHAHSVAEERTVYAVLEEHTGLAEAIEESFDVHGDIEHLLLGLDVGAGDDRFLEQVLRLRAVVRHHVHEEEEVILQQAAAIVGLEESREMARAYQAEKQDETANLGRTAQPAPSALLAHR